jgi:hypothetical protein
MTTITKDDIMNELNDLPDDLAQEILDFIRFIKVKRKADKTMTALASEKVLSKDWLSTEEEEAWEELILISTRKS